MIKNLGAIVGLSLMLAGCGSVSKMKTDNNIIAKNAVANPNVTETDNPNNSMANGGYSAVMSVDSQPVPEFTLPDLFTQKIITNADLPKRPYLINFWASWCVTCKLEQPFLLQLAKQGVPIVGVNYKDDKIEALTYLKTYQNPFLFSVQDTNGWFSHMGLTGIPESFVVDANNKVRLHLFEINQQNLDKHILPCIQALNQNASEAEIKKACQ